MDKEVIDKVFGEKVGRMVDEIVPPFMLRQTTRIGDTNMLS